MRILLLAIALLLAAAQSASPPELAAELARVRAEVSSAVPADQRAPLIARLDRAATALDAHRSYLALYLLESAYETAGASTFATASGVTTAEGFLTLWTTSGAPVPAVRPAAARPAIVDALAAAAEGRASATY